MKKIKLFLLILMIVCGGAVFTACGCTPKVVALESVGISQTSVEMYTGDIVTLDITFNPTNTTDKLLTLSAYDTNVVEAIYDSNTPNQLEIRAVDEIVNGNYQTTLELKSVNDPTIKVQCVVSVLELPDKLQTPTGLTYNGTQLVWNAVNNPNVMGYVLNINGQNMPETTNTYYSINTYGEELICKVKAKGIRETVDSDYSGTYIFSILQTPNNLHHYDQLLTWEGVQGADYYDISINSGIVYAGEEEEFSLELADAGTYTLKVRACSNDDTVFASNFSTQVIVTKLSAPSNFRFEQNRAVWGSVTNATGYKLFIDEESFITTSINYSLPTNLTVGAHYFSIIALGDKTNTLNSNSSATISITKLTAPTNVRAENGILMWDEDVHASSYILSINTVEMQISNNYYELSSYSSGTYNIKVTSNGDGENFVKSFSSDAISVVKLATPTIQNLNNVISWTNVSNASLYELKINSNIVTLSTNSYSFPLELSSGAYAFSVRALADGYLYSNYSSVLTVQKISSPANLRVENGVLTWDSITDAIDYILDIDGTEISCGTQTNFNFADFLAGTYSVKVKAKGNSSSTFVSDYSSAISVTKLPSPILTLNSGVVEHTTISNASGYKYSVNGVEQSTLPVGADNQVMNIKIKAIGDSSTYLTSEYSSVLQATQMAKTSDLHISDGILLYSQIAGTQHYEITIVNNTLPVDDLYQKVTINNENNLSYNLNNYEVGSYTVTVKSIGNSGVAGNLNLYLNNTISNTVSFTRLATPTDLRITDVNDYLANSTIENAPGQVTWVVVSSAVSYSLFVDGGEISTGKANRFILGEQVSTGTHQITIKAIGDGINTISSDESTYITVNKLQSPTNIRVENGLLKWDTIYNQSSFFGTTIPDAAFVVVVDGNAYMATATYGGGEITFPDDILVTSYDLDNSIGAGIHSVEIYTVPINNGIAGSYKSNCLISDSTNPITVTRISNPLNLRMENSIIKWERQLSASSYILKINDDEITISDSTTTQYEFTSSNYSHYAVGDFSITIRALTIFENHVNSKYSNNIDATVMSSSIVNVQNGNLAWNLIDGAEYYELTINDTTINVGIQSTYTLDSTYLAGEYTIKLRVIGDDSRYITSVYSNILNAVKLATPTNLNVEDGKIQFTPQSPLDQTNYFKLYVNSSTKNIGLSYWLELAEEFAAGSYEIRVQAMGDSTIYLNSDISALIEQSPVTKLGYTSNVYVENGILKWASVANANGYIVNIGNVDFDAGTSLSFVISDSLTDINGNTVNIPAGSYAIKIKTVGTDMTYLNSNYTTAKTFTKLPAITNLRIEDGVITWNALSSNQVPNKLQVHINSDVVLIDNTNSYVLSSAYAAGTYSIYVVNLGDNVSYTNSMASQTIEVIKLATPTGLETTEGSNLTFSEITNASAYEIKIVKDGVELDSIIIEETTYSIIDLENLTAGIYNFSVRALGDDSTYVNSEFCQAVTITKPEQPVLSAVYDASIATGKITWNAVNYASGYRLIYSVTYADNTTYATDENGIDLGNTTTYYLLGSGTYSLQLVAYVSYLGINSDISNTLNVSFAVFEGKGTSEEPYLINNASLFNKIYYNPTAYYLLNANISYTGVVFRANSSLSNPFVGTIDGGNYSITNINISNINEIAGLVTVLGEGGTVKNITLNANFTSGYVLGGIAGYNYGTITNCKVHGTISTNTDSTTNLIYNGGVAGKNYGTINSSINYATVYPINNYNLVYAGGVCAYNYGTIYQSGNYGTITANIAGGVAGFNETTIAESFNKGNVTANALNVVTISISGYAGGIAGYSTNKLNHSINNCYNLGTITSISAVYNLGAYAGGIVGKNSSLIFNCYNAGLIYADNTMLEQDTNVYKGGIVGYNDGGTITTKCYYSDKQDSDALVGYNGTSATVTKRSDADLKTEAFKNNMGTAKWKTNSGNYIILAWE